MMNGLKKEQALLEAVQSAETAAIRLRQYAAAELTGRQSATSVSGEAKDITSVEFTTEGWLSLLLPAMLPKRADGDRSRFLASLLRDAIRREYQETRPPKFRTCVLVYEHIYDISRSHRFIDHDNLELKHCQDVLEAAFLVNDPDAGAVPRVVEVLSWVLEERHRNHVTIALKNDTKIYFGKAAHFRWCIGMGKP